MKGSAAILFLIACLTLPMPALAVQPNEMLGNAQLEARARALSKDLRCLVCQNQSIDDSDADLAHDLRILVRQRLQAGDSDAEVKQYLVARYGDYILLDPPFKMATLVLWTGPVFFVATGAAVAALAYRRRKGSDEIQERPLSPEEQQKLKALIAAERQGDGA